MSVLNLDTWRRATRQEISEFIEQKGTQGRRRKKGGVLIVRKAIRPVDIYSYLRARFGYPNGIQNFLRPDDSDNWIHWDFNLKAGSEDIYIAGTSRDTHFHLPRRLSDLDWLALIAAIKQDFGASALIKNNMMKSFEKFFIFQNKYVALADACAVLHEKIVDAPNIEIPLLGSTKASVAKSMKARKKLSERSASLYSDCLTLSLLTPIMAEAYINMFILIFCKDSIRRVKTAYDEFVRQKIHEKISLLHENCQGLRAPINRNDATYKTFLQIMNKRNFAIHGNVDPDREKLETVFFEGKRPLFEDGGDHLLRFFESLEKVYKPSVVIADYEGAHAFLAALRNALMPRYQKYFDHVIDDAYPGYEVRMRRVTTILPSTVMMSVMDGIRYDDELCARES